ncbi:GNAT family N-acetyltransferase [Qipengyuania flava]|nr:GNAT family N-acetyltransferase [Qipengyuania flava]
MARCEAELSLTPDDAGKGSAMVADRGALVGVVQVERDTGRSCSLEKLFVDPDSMGTGLGRHLFAWAVSRARALGAREMVVEADPGAVPFYLRMGCKEAGSVPSGSIPGRSLPRLVYSLG